MIDAHCHLQLYEGALAPALARAREAGVTGFLVADYDAERRPNLLALDAPDIWRALGLHPWALSGRDDVWLDDALHDLERALTSNPNVVAVGEFGLDDAMRRTPNLSELQRRAFHAQMSLAQARELPVILHAVSCHDELLGLLRDLGHVPGGMMHGYAGPAALMEAFCDLGFVLSFGTPLTWRGHKKFKAAFVQAVERGLPWTLETDAPSRAPEPHRGEQNEPWMLGLVWDAASELTGLPRDELARRSDAALRAHFPEVR